MYKALKRIEAHERATGTAGLDAYRATDQIEPNEEKQHTEDGDTADPAKSDLVKLPPITAGRLLDDVGFGVGNGSASLYLFKLLEQLLFLHRLRSGVDQALLRQRWDA